MAQRAARSRPIALDRITAAAREIIALQGVEGLSMRGLASRLNIAPMSLYSHVDSKEDLLNKIADNLLDELEVPVLLSGEWQEHIMIMMRRFYDLLVENPYLAQLLATQRVISVGLTRFIEAILQVLQSAGFSEEESARGFMAFLQYTYGSACLAVPRSTLDTQGVEGDTYALNRLETIFQSGRFPLYTALAGTLFRLGHADTFEHGLTRLIDGFTIELSRGLDD